MCKHMQQFAGLQKVLFPNSLQQLVEVCLLGAWGYIGTTSLLAGAFLSAEFGHVFGIFWNVCLLQSSPLGIAVAWYQLPSLKMAPKH